MLLQHFDASLSSTTAPSGAQHPNPPTIPSSLQTVTGSQHGIEGCREPIASSSLEKHSMDSQTSDVVLHRGAGLHQSTLAALCDRARATR